MSADHIYSEFAVHMLNETGKERATRLAGLFSWLLTEVKAIVPPGRELALVITKLEEACFFAKKGMAKNPDNQEREPFVQRDTVPAPLTNTEIVGAPEQPK